MGLIRALKNWQNKKKNSDLNRIRITSSGAFYMKSEDLFNNKQESLKLLNELNKSVDNYNRLSKKEFASAE